MTIRTRIEPIDDWISLTVDQTLSPESRSNAVAKFARERRQEASDVNTRVLGRVPRHETFVDGRKGAPLESVDPDRGVIVVEFELLTDVLRWIGHTLFDRSPVISGKYRQGHTLFADGVEVPISATIPEAEEYSFTNMTPYARKIEIGKTKSGRAFVIQVEPRTYERTAKEARGRFGNIAKIEYTFRGIVGGKQVNPLGLTRNKRGQGSHNKPQNRFPTIVVRPN